MADFVFSYALERLHNLASGEAKLLHGVSSQVEQIRVELKRMQCFLKDADATQHEGERFQNWVLEIREIAYEVEDVLENFLLKVESRRRGGIQNSLMRCAGFVNETRALHKVGMEISAIKTRILELTTSLQTYGIRSISEGEGSSNERLRQLRRSYSHVVEEDFIGLEEDVETVVEMLVNKESCHRIVSICGMGGLGKTTIAQKIYNHRKIKKYFDGLAWTCISQQWQAKDVLQGILVKLLPERRDQIMKLREEELVRALLEVQHKQKCLVVIDDIWSVDAWNSLKHAFAVGKFETKLLLTTRNKEVALYVDPKGFLYEPRLLSGDESWELLQRKVGRKFGGSGSGPEDDKNMEELGRKMVGHCGGLPLAIVVLGGILVSKYTLREWEMVQRNIVSYIRKGKGAGHPYEGVSHVLALSYDDLPYQLKSCFLYLCSFPEDAEIEAEKIFQIWMAEGMLSHDDRRDGEAMMDVAERYLDELAQRSIVQIQVDEFTGQFKSCRLHDLMRDLCLSKAKQECFLEVFDLRHGNDHVDNFCSSSPVSQFRRIASYIGEDLEEYVSLRPKMARHLRSALFFLPNTYLCVPMPPKLRSELTKFKMLKVLDIEKYQFNKKLGKSLKNLSHLRYLSLKNTAFRKLPSSIANLHFLQTLDLRLHSQLHVSGTLPDVLWKMTNLRHLYIHDLIRTPTKKLRLNGLNKLEILETFYSRLFDVKDLFKLNNLWKVRAHIQVKIEQELVDIINYLTITANKLRYSSFFIGYKFSSVEELALLSQLLQCHHLNELHIDGFISMLPHEIHCFSSTLTSLKLSNCELKEDPMKTLEKLPNLRSLQLGDDAFFGEEIVCLSNGFPQLRILELFDQPNFKEWRIDEGAMPKLYSLEINSCWELSKIPDGLRFFTNLEELKIINTTEEFQLRLRVVNGKEGEDVHKVRHVPSITFSPIYMSM